MVRRTASAIAMLLIGLDSVSGQAVAQYHPPQTYPPPQGYPSVADADDAAPALNAPVLQGPALPPIGVAPRAAEPQAGTQYPSGGGQGYRSMQSPQAGTHPYYGAIPPGPAGSAEQDAIRQEAMRSRLPTGQIGPGPLDPRETHGRDPRNMAASPPDVPQGRSVPEGYEPAVIGTRPYYSAPGGIPPGPAGSAKQDAIRQDAMRPTLPTSPGRIGTAPVDSGMGDARKMAAFPPDVQPETGPKKELAPQFRRTLVDYWTKEPAGTIIIATPNTYLYLVLGNGKALRYGVGVGREGFTWSGAERVTKMAEWPDWNPPEEMIVRQPYLPRFMAGGETNPLGARALYLGKTVYRIHGTNQPSTIGLRLLGMHPVDQ
ncbi:MAG: L,D-transpeptidase family protein [Rudaea sp.]